MRAILDLVLGYYWCSSISTVEDISNALRYIPPSLPLHPHWGHRFWAGLFGQGASDLLKCIVHDPTPELVLDLERVVEREVGGRLGGHVRWSANTLIANGPMFRSTNG